MGGSFFKSIMPPSFFGGQSTMGKAVFNDPINRATGGIIAPQSGNYGSGQWRGSVVAPNAYQGVAPSMAAAQTGYGTLTPQQQAASAYGQAVAKPYNVGTPAPTVKGGGGGNAGRGW